MGKRICKGNQEWEDVTHYVITEFMQRSDVNALIERGEALKLLSGMIHLSYYSHTSPYHKLYRQSGRVHELYESTSAIQVADEDYDLDGDLLTEEILGILTDMESESVDLWYIATLFKMYVEDPNYSEIGRKTGIPRTSISTAVEECRQYIKNILKTRDL